MTDATLTIILNSIPSITGAFLAGVGSIFAAKALRKGTENGETAKAVAQKTEETHTMVGDNLPGLTKTVERHEILLQKLDVDVRSVVDVVTIVRARQHDIADYFQALGVDFELRKMPKPGEGT